MQELLTRRTVLVSSKDFRSLPAWCLIRKTLSIICRAYSNFMRTPEPRLGTGTRDGANHRYSIATSRNKISRAQRAFISIILYTLHQMPIKRKRTGRRNLKSICSAMPFIYNEGLRDERQALCRQPSSSGSDEKPCGACATGRPRLL